MNIRKDILKINLTIAKFTKEQIETIIQCIQHAEQNYVDYMESQNIDYSFYYEPCVVCQKLPCECKNELLEEILGPWNE